MITKAPLRNVYRVEHEYSKDPRFGHLFLGPYQYSNKLPVGSPLRELAGKYEPSDETPSKRYRLVHAGFRWSRPGPAADPLIKDRFMEMYRAGYEWQQYVFGFEDDVQFRQWYFNPVEVRMLHEHGFIIAQYKSNDVILGTKQLMFRYNPEEMKRINTFRLESFNHVRLSKIEAHILRRRMKSRP
jgi:hypothetical protein